jgi:sugar phosphate isomerase/epimerase
MKIGIMSRFGRNFWEYLSISNEIGIECLELWSYPGYWKDLYTGYAIEGIRNLWPTGGFPPEYADPATGMPSLELKEKIETYGIKVTSFYHRNNFLTFDDIKLDYEVKRIKDLCDTANKWGVEVARVEGGEARNTLVWNASYEKCIELIIEGYKKCIKYAEDTGVYLAIENHYHILQDANILIKILKEVNSDHLGVTVDTGNFSVYGHKPEVIKKYFMELAPYTFNTHIKDGKIIKEYADKGPLDRIGYWELTSLGEGEVPIKFFVDELKKHGYKRTLNIHGISEDPRISAYESLKKSYNYLKSII